MFVSIFIILISVMLFVYWFRYTCVLILNARTSRNYAIEIAHANHLNFIENRQQLLQAESGSLDPILKSLDRDFRLITYLLRHAASYNVPGDEIERFILMIDFHVMKLWYAAIRGVSSVQARKALLEMTSIINHFANSMGERVAVSARS